MQEFSGFHFTNSLHPFDFNHHPGGYPQEKPMTPPHPKRCCHSLGCYSLCCHPRRQSASRAPASPTVATGPNPRPGLTPPALIRFIRIHPRRVSRTTSAPSGKIRVAAHPYPITHVFSACWRIVPQNARLSLMFSRLCQSGSPKSSVNSNALKTLREKQGEGVPVAKPPRAPRPEPLPASASCDDPSSSRSRSRKTRRAAPA